MTSSPKLPSVRELARELRAIGTAYDSRGRYVELVEHAGTGDYYPRATIYDLRGAEFVPGDGAPFDAHAAARRLLSDARLAMKGMR